MTQSVCFDLINLFLVLPQSNSANIWLVKSQMLPLVYAFSVYITSSDNFTSLDLTFLQSTNTACIYWEYDIPPSQRDTTLRDDKHLTGLSHKVGKAQDMSHNADGIGQLTLSLCTCL